MQPVIPSGVTGRRKDMTTKTLSTAKVDSGLLSIAAAAFAGLMLLGVAGFAQASVIHDSAHDTRHAIAFPCH